MSTLIYTHTDCLEHRPGRGIRSRGRGGRPGSTTSSRTAPSMCSAPRVHHGNGTQNSFYDEPELFYGSCHQSPFCRFDAHQKDSLGGLDFSDDDFHRITRELMAATESSTGGRVASVLEGG